MPCHSSQPNRARQGKAKGKARQGKARQGKARHGKALRGRGLIWFRVYVRRATSSGWLSPLNAKLLSILIGKARSNTRNHYVANNYPSVADTGHIILLNSYIRVPGTYDRYYQKRCKELSRWAVQPLTNSLYLPYCNEDES